MNLSEFEKIVEERKKRNPFWFDDTPEFNAKHEHIEYAEDKLGVKLPERYKYFVTKFGGGYFAFTNVFSVNEDGDWFIVDKNKSAINYVPAHFIAFSDDEAGGLFGFIANDGVCGEEVFYWDNDSNSVGEKLYDDILDYVVDVGLKN